MSSIWGLAKKLASLKEKVFDNKDIFQQFSDNLKFRVGT